MATAEVIKRSGADVVYLGGLECENGSKLIKDLRATLGRNFPLIAPDGFSSFGDTFRNSGGAAAGMFISVAGAPNASLGPAGKSFVRRFGSEIGRNPNPYSAYAAQAMNIVLSSVAASNGRRSSVSAHMRSTHVRGGLLGTFSFNRNGDTTLNFVTQYRLNTHGAGVPYKVIVPPARLVGT